MKRILAILLLCAGVTGYGQSLPCVADSCCLAGTVWSEELGGCVVANPSDTDFDGCVGIGDFLVHLSNFGSGCVYEPEQEGWSCGESLEYQGHSYETVQIGEQCWFAENLRAENYRNGSPISTTFTNSSSSSNGVTAILDGDSSNLELSGRLYNLHAVTYPDGLCPANWRVGSFEDWDILEMAVAPVGPNGPDENYSGQKLKNSPNDDPPWNGTNDHGFNAYKGGAATESGQYLEHDRAQWWSSTVNEFGGAIRPMLSDGNGMLVLPNDWNSPWNFYNVRCIKDTE